MPVIDEKTELICAPSNVMVAIAAATALSAVAGYARVVRSAVREAKPVTATKPEASASVADAPADSTPTDVAQDSENKK